MTGAVSVVMTPDLKDIVTRALRAFRAESSYTADMISAARTLEARKAKR